MSLMAIALPIGIFGAYFSEIWNEHEEVKKKEREAREEKEKEAKNGGRIMSKFDTQWQLEKLASEIAEIIEQMQDKKNVLDHMIEKMKKKSAPVVQEDT